MTDFYEVTLKYPKTICKKCGISILKIEWLPEVCYDCRERLNEKTFTKDEDETYDKGSWENILC